MSDEEEVVDPKIKLEEKCASTASCARLMVAYQQCAERVRSAPRFPQPPSRQSVNELVPCRRP